MNSPRKRRYFFWRGPKKRTDKLSPFYLHGIICIFHSKSKGVFSLMPGPGARTFCAKTMRRLPFHEPGGQPKCGMRIEKEKLKIRNPQFEIRNPMGRCFLRRSSLPPGHNSSIPKMSIPPQAGPPAEPGVYLKEINYYFFGTFHHEKAEGIEPGHTKPSRIPFPPVPSGSRSWNRSTVRNSRS